MSKNTRNALGLKDDINRYRTFGGHQYLPWVFNPTVDAIDALKASGIRCRRVKDVLFIHHMDEDEARAFDRAASASLSEAR